MTIEYDKDIANDFSGGIVYDKEISELFSGDYSSASLLNGENLRKISIAGMGISAISEIGSSIAGYFQTKTQADNLRLQADQIGTQALQQGNQLREKLYADISNSFAGYAARGIDIGSGTPMTMARMTMKEGGEDIAQINKNAKIQADAARAQADALKRGSTLDMFAGMAGAISKLSLAKGLL